uniref:Type II toxin-antitoxin system HicA family toxin n=1 Tax=candidate division WOR-3 bacterium TaxID=2052148 RepID=A0A7V0Z7J5_UNCW3
MKLPRDLGDEELAKILAKYGFRITRQTGSHIRLTTLLKGESHITIPKRKVLKVGTLNNILTHISQYLEKDKQSLYRRIV